MPSRVAATWQPSRAVISRHFASTPSHSSRACATVRVGSWAREDRTPKFDDVTLGDAARADVEEGSGRLVLKGGVLPERVGFRRSWQTTKATEYGSEVDMVLIHSGMSGS